MKELTTDKLVTLLAERIALDNFDVNKSVYAEERVSYANEGVTERTYMKDTVESVDWTVEDLIEKLEKRSKKHYKKLVKELYK